LGLDVAELGHFVALHGKILGERHYPRFRLMVGAPSVRSEPSHAFEQKSSFVLSLIDSDERIGACR
jgi:hypothetical protein